MQQHGIIHPYMLQRLTPNFYPSLCTIKSVTVEMVPPGEEVVTEVEVLADVPCRMAPDSSKEVTDPQQEFVEARLHVTLAGYYPQIDSDMTPVIDGVAYEMWGEPEHDGNHKETRFYVRVVE